MSDLRKHVQIANTRWRDENLVLADVVSVKADDLSRLIRERNAMLKHLIEIGAILVQDGNVLHWESDGTIVGEL